MVRLLFYNGSQGSIDRVKQLLGSHPQLATMRAEDGCLPLHIALRDRRGNAAECISAALLTAYPQATSVADDNGLYALHFAAAIQTGDHGAAVVNLLLQYAPEIATKRNKDGQTPLDMALKRTERDFKHPNFSKISDLDPLVAALRTGTAAQGTKITVAPKVFQHRARRFNLRSRTKEERRSHHFSSSLFFPLLLLLQS